MIRSSSDIVIVGGGMVGYAAAALLGASIPSTRVTLLDAGRSRPRLQVPPKYQNRVSACSPASVELFKRLGVWDRLCSARVKRTNKLHVVESHSQSEISFEQPDSSAVAYIIENDLIVGGLSEAVERFPSVTVRTGTKVTACRLPGDVYSAGVVELEGGESIEAQLIVGADGAGSAVRKSMSVDHTGWSYDQSGVVGIVEIHPAGNNDVAWQRFLPTGPVALLPLTESLSAVIWSTTPDRASQLCSMPEAEFVDELNHCVHTCHDTLGGLLTPFLPKIPSPPPYVMALHSPTRQAFPMGFFHAHKYVAPRVALVGDAAHRVHSLAGQGVNMGWRDCRHLVECVERTTAAGGDIGSPTRLEEYEAAAKKHNLPVMVTVDWLNRLYSTSAPPLVLIRSLGLSAVNAMLPLKDLLIHSLSKY